MKRSKTNHFVSYLRVSTTRQGLSGLGLEAQRAAVDQYITISGGNIAAEFVEVESGAKRGRPILAEALAECRRLKATLLIAKLDRLARNVAFVSSLMEGGVDFVAVDAPFANKLMIHILAAFAEHEREQISERTRRALAAAKARGIQLGRNGAVLAEANRAEAVVWAEKVREPALQAISEGAGTLATLSAHLNNSGCRTREGSMWSPGTTSRLLARLNINLNSCKNT